MATNKPQPDALDVEVNEARKRGRERLQREPRALSASYDAKTKRIKIELSNNCTFIFPPDIAQGLRGANATQLSDIEIFGGGLYLGWEQLDAHLTLAGLLAGIFGTKKWMSELGRAGGSISSESKAVSSRANGAKGGRPRKKQAA